MALHAEQVKIVESIISSLENGVLPWRKQYEANGSKRGLPYNAKTGSAYSGINVLVLLMKGYPISGGWLTYKQAQDCGGNVMKGAKSTVIFYYQKCLDKKKTKESGKDVHFMLCKSYLVFHISQCENIDTSKLFKFPQEEIIAPRADMRNIQAELFVKATGAKITTKNEGHACYIPALDMICIHEIESYESGAAYYSTLFHELGHWTGPRLKRDQSTAKNSKVYGKEELVAELCACFTLPQFGMNNLENNERYLGAWVKMLKETPAILMQAASAASTASAFLGAFQTGEIVETECEELADAA